MSLATVEERLARLEAHVEDLRVTVGGVDSKLDAVQSTLDRRLGVESLGKFLFPFVAVVVSALSLALTLGVR